MKKLFGLLVMLVVGITLVGCFDLGETSTLEITKAPASSYAQGFIGEVNFAFKVDDIEYNVVWKSGDVDSVTVGTTTYDKSKLIADGITISGLDFSTVGTKVLVVRYGSLSAQFEYTVVGASAISGTGTVDDPYIVHTAEQLISKKAEMSNSNYVYFKLGADLNFANIDNNELGFDVYNVSINGSKALGGNYKIVNLQTTLFGSGDKLVLKNIDFVDCYSLTGPIIGKSINNFDFDNVNLLSNTTADAAGYLLTPNVGSFKNCTSYATIQSFTGQSQTAGFIRRQDGPGTITFDNCKNYGNIHSYGKIHASSFAGMMTETSNCIINYINCENHATIYIYDTHDNIVSARNAALKNKLAAYTAIIGPTDSTTDLVNLKSSVIKDGITNTYFTLDQYSYNNMNSNFVYEEISSVNFGDTVTAPTNIVKYQVQVVSNNSSGYVLNDQNDGLTRVSSGGMLIYDSGRQPVGDNHSFDILTSDTMKTYLNTVIPGYVGVEGEQKGAIKVYSDVSKIPTGQNHYNSYYAAGNHYRLPSLEGSNVVFQIIVFGFTETNEIVLLGIGSKLSIPM